MHRVYDDMSIQCKEVCVHLHVTVN